jgi:hypothetical protein
LRTRTAATSFACIVLALALTVSTERGAHAEDPRSAAEQFRLGEAAYGQRRFREAALAFEAANRLAPRAAALHAAGVSWHEAGELARAADALELALAGRDLDDESRHDARARLARLLPLVATVDVDGPRGATVNVAHARAARVPAKIHVTPGEHVLERADLAGAPTVRIVVAAGETVRVVVGDRSAILPPGGPTPTASSSASTLGWVGVGAAAVFSASAVALGLATLGARDDFVASGNTDASARDRALALRTLTNAAWVAAAVSGIGGGLALVLAPSPAPTRGIAAEVSYTFLLF